MQTYYGEATVNQQGQVTLVLPFPNGQRVEIVARPVFADISNDQAEDKSWERMALDAFIEGYAEEDSIYDNYHEWRKNTGSEISS
jgi:hypothetical protein